MFPGLLCREKTAFEGKECVKEVRLHKGFLKLTRKHLSRSFFMYSKQVQKANVKTYKQQVRIYNHT